MRMRIERAKQILCSRRGETLTESIVSFLVFLVFLLAVTVMIRASLRMTSASTQSAAEMQKDINLALLSDYKDSDETDITFTSGAMGGIEASHEIILNKSDGFIAFAPKGE